MKMKTSTHFPSPSGRGQRVRGVALIPSHSPAGRRERAECAKRIPGKYRGAALVSAIFLLVVLAALGAYMLTLSGVEQTTLNRSLINARTYYAARAGLEWGIHRAVAPPTLGNGECATSAQFSLTGYGLDDIQVTVECASNLYTPGDNTYVYTLTSIARYGTAGTVDYSERKLETTVCRSANSGTNRC